MGRRAAKGGHAQPLAGVSEDDHSAVAPTHPLNKEISKWKSWRHRYPIRAQPLARFHTCESKPNPSVQEAWHVLRPSVTPSCFDPMTQATDRLSYRSH